MAEDTVDDGAARRSGARASRRTKRLPLLGADGYRPTRRHRRLPTSPTATARLAAEVAALHRRRPSPRRAARARPALHHGRGRVRGASRDGDDARRRAVAPHPGPPVRPAGDRRRRRRRRPTDRRRAGLGRRRGRAAGRRVPQLVRAEQSGRRRLPRPTCSESIGDASRRRRSSSPARPSRFAAPTASARRALIARLERHLRDHHVEPRRPPRPAATGGRWRCTGRSPARCRSGPPRSCRPTTTEQVAAVLSAVQRRTACRSRPPAAAAACRGASVPVFGGVVLDLTAMQGIVDGRRRLRRGRGLGRHVRARPREPSCATSTALTVGHFPQSFDIATVGGWVACRGAGQYTTRYGKIERHGRRPRGRARRRHACVRTGGGPAAAMGPDLTQLFVGTEGTLGVITRVWLRAHPCPTARAPRRLHVRHVRRRASRPAGGSCAAARRPPCCACTTPSRRSAATAATARECVLLVLDEGDIGLVEATMAVVDDECAAALPARRRPRRALAARTATTPAPCRR